MKASSSHRIERKDGRVVVKDLEVFAAFDPSFDKPDDPRLKGFDTEDAIDEIIRNTVKFEENGQRVQLIPDHNFNGSNMPSLGSFTGWRKGRTKSGVPMAVADLEMSEANFSKWMATNEYPRRSAEISPKHRAIRQVALQGSSTPHRPIPDAYFADGEELLHFDQDELPAFHFAASTKEPAMDPTVQEITKERDTLRDKVAQLQSELDQKSAKLDEQTAQFSEFQRGQSEMEKTFNDALAKMRTELTRGTFEARLKERRAKGLRIEDAKFSQVLDRIVGSSDPEAEFAFFCETLPSDPIDVDVSSGQSPDSANFSEVEYDATRQRGVLGGKRMQDAVQRAQKRVEREGLHGSEALMKFSEYLNEEQKRA